MKPTCEKLRELEKEEKKSSKEYAALGLKAFSKDEARHGTFFGALLKRRKCK